MLCQFKLSLDVCFVDMKSNKLSTYGLIVNKKPAALLCVSPAPHHLHQVPPPRPQASPIGAFPWCRSTASPSPTVAPRRRSSSLMETTSTNQVPARRGYPRSKADRKQSRLDAETDRQDRMRSSHAPGTWVWAKIPKRGRPRLNANPNGLGPFRVLTRGLGYVHILTGPDDTGDVSRVIASEYLYPVVPSSEVPQASGSKLFQEGENDAGPKAEDEEDH